MKNNLFARNFASIGALLGFRRGDKNTTEITGDVLYKNRLSKNINIDGVERYKLPRPARDVFGRILVSSFVVMLMLAPLKYALAASGVTLDSFSGQPTTIHVSGWGFDNGESISIYFKEASGTPVATATGAADSSFGPTAVTIPVGTVQGALPILVVGSAGHTGSNSYYVVPFSASIDVASAPNTPGSSVSVSGSGYAPGETVNFTINGAKVGSAAADGSGAFTGGSFTVPSVATGTYQLHGTGASSGADAVFYFYVGGFYPSAYPSTYYVLPGQQVAFSGSGFAPGEGVDVLMLPGTTPAATFTVNSSGEFTNAGGVTVPADTVGGAHTFKLLGRGSSGGNVEVMVTVGMLSGQVFPSAFFVTPGDVLNFNGSGFLGGETVNVTVDDASGPVATFNADSSGEFKDSGNVTVPFGFAGGTHIYKLTGASSHTGGSVSIGVAGFFPSITPDTYYVLPGQTFTVSGSGYAPGENVEVTMNSGFASTVKADTSGSFTSPSFTAPFTGTAMHMKAEGKTSGVSAAVDVSLGTLYPSVAPDAYYVHAGGKINFSGSGFAPGESVTLSGGGSSKNFVVDSFGGFEGQQVTTPFGPDAGIAYSFTGASSGAAVTVNVTVAGVHPIVSSDNYYATPGTIVNITGISFSPGETVNVKMGSETASAVADELGTATAAITIPFGVNTASVAAVMTGATSGGSGSTNITLAPFYPSVTPSTWYTAPGTSVTFTGTGFASGETVTMSLNGAESGTASVNSEGGVSFSALTIPFSAKAAHFSFVGNKSNAPASVDVGLSGFAPQITPSTWYAAAGSNITFSGTGFAPGETVTMTPGGTFTADSEGGFTSSSVSVPFSANSVHVEFSSSVTGVSQKFDIGVAPLSPGIWLSTYYDQGGKPLTVFGGGFGGGETVHVTFGGAALGDVTTDAGGNFELKTTVPYQAAGSKTIQAHGGSSNANSTADFTMPQVYTSVQLGSYAGAPGSAVNFIGLGFLPGEPVEITTDRTGSAAVHTFNADATGSFNDSGYALPADFTGGPLTLTIKGKNSFTTTDIVYYVTGP